MKYFDQKLPEAQRLARGPDFAFYVLVNFGMIATARNQHNTCKNKEPEFGILREHGPITFFPVNMLRKPEGLWHIQLTASGSWAIMA